MKLGVTFGGGVKKDQYSYIQVFIDYLNQIIEIIKGLFSFMKGMETEKETDPAEPVGSPTDG